MNSSSHIDSALAHLTTVLRNLGVPGLDALQPGLTTEAIERLTGRLPFAFPLELQFLYQWHNGTSPATGQNRLFPGGGFPPLADALAVYEDFRGGARRATQGTGTDPDLVYDAHWFPVLFSYGNSVYVVECGSGAAAGSVWELLVEDASQRQLVGKTLAGFIEQVALRWERGAYYFDEQPREDYAELAAERRVNDHNLVDVPALVHQLTSDEPLERVAATRRLKEFLYPEAGPLLLELLGNPDREVRSIAVSLLGQMAEPAYFDALISSLDDREYSVREGAKWALAELQRKQKRRPDTTPGVSAMRP